MTDTMRSLQRCGVAWLVALGCAVSALAQNADEVEVTSQAVAGGIYMLQGTGGNIGVWVGDDGVFVVDDDYSALGDKIFAAIRALSDKPLRFVINTHWHSDHTGGNDRASEAGAIVIAHRNVRQRMSATQFVQALEREFEPAPDGALPVVTFSQELRFHLNGDDIEVRHFPRAHTDGDAAVYFPTANVIHTGDIYRAGQFPFIDTSTGGSLAGTIDAVRAILRMGNDDTRIIPGHGPLSNKAELREYLEMLDIVRERFNKLLGAGYGREVAIRSGPLSDMAEKWGQGFIDADKMAGIVYDDMRDK